MYRDVGRLHKEDESHEDVWIKKKLSVDRADLFVICYESSSK